MTVEIASPTPIRAADRRLARAARVSFRLVVSVALTFLGLTFVTFAIGRVIPIDPVLAIVGDHATQEVYEKVKEELGLNFPIYQQYWNYLVKVLTGDFGVSRFTAQPVLVDILTVFPATLELATVAIVIGVAFGVPMGVAAAANQGRWPDHVIRLVGLIGYSMPVFWLGLVGLLVFYAKLQWVGAPSGRLDIAYEYVIEPVTGLVLVDTLLARDWGAFKSAFSHIILPASILGYLSLAYIARMTRSFMLGQLGQEYVLTAQVKGLSRRRVVWGHAFRNIQVPLITVIALSYGFLLEGAVLTETVFAWPGIGRYLTNSLFNGDMNAVLGSTIVVCTMFIGLNLLSDLTYHLVDPRAR